MSTQKPSTLFAVWNTGRQYTENGQRMAARIVGDVILFADVDRGIAGKITTTVPAQFIRSTYELERKVMSAYDVCAYEWEGSEHYEALQELKAAAEAQQVPAAPEAEEPAPQQDREKTGLSIADILPQYKLDRLSRDHAGQMYVRENQHLLIECHGFYSFSELDEKIRLLREAQREVFGY